MKTTTTYNIRRPVTQKTVNKSHRTRSLSLTRNTYEKFHAINQFFFNVTGVCARMLIRSQALCSLYGSMV